MDDQIIIRITHFVDRFELVGEALVHLFGRCIAVAAMHTFRAEAVEIRDVFLARGRFKVRQLRLAEFELDVAAFGDACGVIAGFRRVGEQRAHLLFRLIVKLGARKREAGILRQCFAGLDAQQNAVHLLIIARQIMAVVRRDQRQRELAREL